MSLIRNAFALALRRFRVRCGPLRFLQRAPATNHPLPAYGANSTATSRVSATPCVSTALSV
jgi:hypothetical protein